MINRVLQFIGPNKFEPERTNFRSFIRQQIEITNRMRYSLLRGVKYRMNPSIFTFSPRLPGSIGLTCHVRTMERSERASREREARGKESSSWKTEKPSHFSFRLFTLHTGSLQRALW
jgi:hypothetical protein